MRGWPIAENGTGVVMNANEEFLSADQIQGPRYTWALVALLVFLFQGTAAFAQSASVNAAQKSKEASLEFVDGTAVTLSPDAKVQFKFDILIKNAGDKEGVPSLRLVSYAEDQCGQLSLAREASKKNEILTLEQLETISPKAATVTHATISNAKLPANCYIKLTGGDPVGSSSLKSVKLNQEYLTRDVSCPLYICLGISTGVAFLTWLVADGLLGGLCLNYRLGAPAWELDKSWISNTTIVSSVIATAMALGALPDMTKYASKAGYAALALMISLVVIVAPFIFTAFRVGKVTEVDGKKTIFYDGFLGFFLLSGALTLFAGLAQVVVLFLLFDEIFLGYGYWSFGSNRQPWLSLNVGSASTAGVGVALCCYVALSMYATIKLQTEVDVNAGIRQPKKPKMSKKKIALDPPVPAPPPVLEHPPGVSWPVL
jgi:hypothetical protein